MVIDVSISKQPTSFSEALHTFDMSCSDILNEIQYNILQTRYDYLVETGNTQVDPNNTKVKKSFSQIIKNAVRRFIEALENLKNQVVRRIRSLIEKFNKKRKELQLKHFQKKLDKTISDLEKISEDAKKKCDKAKDDIIDLGDAANGINNPDTMEQFATKANKVTSAAKEAMKEEINKTKIIEAEFEVVEEKEEK